MSPIIDISTHDSSAKAIYLDRFGVNAEHFRQGVGSLALSYAKETAQKMGAEYLRLFVVDINKPAARLYEKSGFIKADGIYDEVIDDELTLHEYGFEVKL